MPSIGSKEILLIFLLLFIVYLVAAMFAANGWVIFRLVKGRRVLPASPLVERRPVPWGLWTVLLILALYLAVNIGAFVAYGKLTGRLPARPARPPAVPATAPAANDSSPDPPVLAEGKRASAKLEPGKVKPEQKLKPDDLAAKDHPVAESGAKPAAADLGISMTEGLAIQAVINVVLLILLPVVLRMTSRSPLRDLGLHFDRWWLQVGVGIIAFLAIQPAISMIQLAMTRIWNNNAHPLNKMVLDEFSPGVPQLAILMAVIVAPVFEEVVFRGIIQSWLASLGSRRGPKTGLVLADVVAIPATEDKTPGPFWEVDSGQPTTDLESEFAETTVKLHLVASIEPPPSRLPSGLAGIVATSLVFAALHVAQWPAPIALFVLSVVIGYVYQRTGSLIAAICIHAAFNGFSTLLLLGFLLAPQSAQDTKMNLKPAVSAVACAADSGSAWMTGEK
jgi:membrane protease YdiL (CAAX protease family)